MGRKKRVDIYAEAPSRGDHDEYPLLELGIEPQLHLSRNSVDQPFFLVCENDCLIAQLGGTARVEFRNASVNYFDLTFGDFVYVPGGTPHRLRPTSPSIHLRYKAEHPGLEAVAWYSEATGGELSRVVWDCAVELPQEGYLRACQMFNRDPAMRTCAVSGDVLPPVDLSRFGWEEVASTIREAEQVERARAEKRGVVLPRQEPRPSGELDFGHPDPPEPMRVNAYWAARGANSQLSPMFPYFGPGCIVPCTSLLDPQWMGRIGYFVHENTVNEVNLCFGAHSKFRAPGAVFVGPMVHGVGEKPGAEPVGEKHGVGEKPGNEDRPDMFAIQVITQRQSVGVPQREAFSIMCERCEAEVYRHPYDAHAFPDPTDDVDDPVLLGLPTISQDAWAVEQLNRNEALRTCRKCGHVNPQFPTVFWGWADYRRRTHVVARGRKLMAEAAARALERAPAVTRDRAAASR